MAELLRTRCTAGWLIITDEAIRIERRGLFGAGKLQQVLPRRALVGASLQNTYPSAFGQGGGNTLTFSGYGAAIVAKMVSTRDAQRAMELLGYA